MLIQLRWLAAAAVFSVFAPLHAQGDLLFTVSAGDGQLRTVSLLTATTTASLQIVRSTGGNATQCNGMARDPISGQVFAVVRFGTAVRNLCALNLQTGVATVRGALADNFAGIAFRADGTLFGVTGDGGATPETLYSINTANAVSTFVMSLGNGNDGETIGFGANNALYHASGFGFPNTDEVFEVVDPVTLAVTNIPLSGYDYDEMLSLVSYTGDNLIGADLNDDLVVLTTAGHASLLGTLDHTAVKGLVFVPSANSAPFFRHYGTGCPLSSGASPILFGSGTPTAGQTVGVHLRHSPVTNFGMLAVGFGSGAVPLPSPTCQVQVNPVIVLTGFFSGAAGEYNYSLPLPPGFSPFDLFFQAGVIDGATFAVSNPLRMHMQ